MIAATLHPSAEPTELALCTSRALISAARTESATILTHARKRASRYRQKAKERGYRAGVELGERESALACARMMESLRELYSTTIVAAHRDARIIAYRIVEELIEQHLRERPETIAHWITRAVEHLKQTSGMTLRYHPRYESTIRRVSSHLPVGLMASVDKTLGAVDFAITTNVGAATFSWRELLDVLKQKADQEQGI
ncbi:MAG: hypothetical protein RIS36_2033 [Pseudomonadota bacterium]